MGSHKTKDQLEIELNELKQLYGEKCSECDFLTKDNRAKSEAVVNACADLKNLRKDLEDARSELGAKEACNKKLADQFYDYRKELVKVRKELADAIEKRDSLKVELEGVRGALKREADLRADTEKKRDEYKQETVKLKTTAEDYQNRWHSACRENERLHNYLNEVEKIQRKHNKLTLEDIDNALRQWSYIDGKLSHDLSMPLESLIQLLDEYGVNDFCKLRERLMYGPTTDYSNALLSIRKLEKRNVDLEGVANDLEKQRKEAVQNFETASRKNNELQNEVNKLRQRWMDEFNPEDELLGRKVLEWQEINVVLAKHNIESSEKLDVRLSCSCPEDYMKVFCKYGVNSSERLDWLLNRLKELNGSIIEAKCRLPALVHLARIFQ